MKKVARIMGEDSKFVSNLLVNVFGEGTLKMSSAGGRKSNFNNVAHNALDQDKLKFIEGWNKLFECMCPL